MLLTLSKTSFAAPLLLIHPAASAAAAKNPIRAARGHLLEGSSRSIDVCWDRKAARSEAALADVASASSPGKKNKSLSAAGARSSAGSGEALGSGLWVSMTRLGDSGSGRGIGAVDSLRTGPPKTCSVISERGFSSSWRTLGGTAEESHC